MSFRLTVRNFGRLSDAKIRIGRFTVLAGPNNTGKSTVLRLLYSLFDAMNANHALTHFQNLARGLEIREDGDEDSPLLSLCDEIRRMESIFMSFSVDSSRENSEKWSDVVRHADGLRDIYRNIKPYIKSRRLERKRRSSPDATEEDLANSEQHLEKNLENLCEKIEKTDIHRFVLAGLEREISRRLIQNFQVPVLSRLSADGKESFAVSIDNVCSFELKGGMLADSKIKPAGFDLLRDWSRVVYLESPVYWKLKSPLESARISGRFRHESRDRLGGVHGHFYDSAEALKVKYSGDIAFPELYKRLTSKEVMGGKLTISEIGELRFQENGRSFPLHLTSTGVINVGILALLIENKVIDEGTFLFIEEPETNLHPSWQVEIARTLFELSRSGVNVVITTHSAEILKFIEVETGENPGSKKLVELNHFSSDGVNHYEDDFDSSMAKINEELTGPYASPYLAGL